MNAACTGRKGQVKSDMGKRPPANVARPESPTVTARATPNGTRRYADTHAAQLAQDFFRPTRTGLTVSSLAFGTYLGESDDATDAQYAEAIARALASGINCIDTAINYRCQRSERVIGRALQEAIGNGTIRREQVVLCTKAGYIPLDGAPPSSREAYAEYVKREYHESGILDPADVVAGGHALSPSFLQDQLGRSLRNLGVQSVDYFYLHNPEQQLAAVSPEELSKRLRIAFDMLEQYVSRGVIGAYGCATWNGLRLPAGSHGHLSLFELARIAEGVAGKDHHFRVVQLPINLSMSEAVRVSTQRDAKGRLVHVTDAAATLGIDLIASAPLLQGQLTAGLPDEVRDAFPGTTDAQRALAFVRAVPSVVAAAVGMRSAAHVGENLAGVRAG